MKAGPLAIAPTTFVARVAARRSAQTGPGTRLRAGRAWIDARDPRCGSDARR